MALTSKLILAMLEARRLLHPYRGMLEDISRADGVLRAAIDLSAQEDYDASEQLVDLVKRLSELLKNERLSVRVAEGHSAALEKKLGAVRSIANKILGHEPLTREEWNLLGSLPVGPFPLKEKA